MEGLAAGDFPKRRAMGRDEWYAPGGVVVCRVGRGVARLDEGGLTGALFFLSAGLEKRLAPPPAHRDDPTSSHPRPRTRGGAWWVRRPPSRRVRRGRDGARWR